MSQSASALRLETRPDGIAVLTFDLPGSRANTLGQAVQAELEAIAHQLSSRTELKGLILRSGKPGMFIAGADLRELGSVKPESGLLRKFVQRGLDIIAAFENLPFPTLAAIDGSCMGGGLELALGFDFRLASTHPKTEIGFPEVKVGLFPGWGGTQRLSRVIGPALTTELICTGDGVSAVKARDYGIVFDAVPQDQLLDESVRILRWAAETGAWHDARRKKRQPVGLSEDQAAFLFAVAKAQVASKSKGQYPAPLAALDAIARGCNLPLDEGLAIETDLFVPLVGSPISKNLIGIFFMTQRLQKDTGVADASITPKEVHKVGVLGAGIMGAGIAGAHVRRGVAAQLLDSIPAALEKGVGGIAKLLQDRVEKGRMTSTEMLGTMGKLTPTLKLADLADRDVVIEAIIENEEIKGKTYRELEALLRPDAILASNTSTISITRMARGVSRPAQFAGMHFFNPVDKMPLVEVIRGEKTSDHTVATLVALAKRIGKTPIVVNDCPGFLVNRILFPYLNEAMVLVEEGIPLRMLDKVATTFGMPMGPVTLSDVVGLDTALYAGTVVNTAFSDRAVHTRILTELVKEKRLGQKSGAGFYSYAKGSRGEDDPAFQSILERCRTKPVELSPEDITDRLFFPMLTEASRILMEGIVREPGDVDMGLILGTGFPPFRGGILRWADALGLNNVLKKMARFEQLGARFHPTEQMRTLAASGRGFYDG